jgi:hypothetical protein
MLRITSNGPAPSRQQRLGGEQRDSRSRAPARRRGRGGADVALRGVDGGDLETQPGHRLGEQAAAAADVEQAQALERRAQRRRAEARERLVADEGQADRVEPCSGANLPFGSHHSAAIRENRSTSAGSMEDGLRGCPIAPASPFVAVVARRMKGGATPVAAFAATLVMKFGASRR